MIESADLSRAIPQNSKGTEIILTPSFDTLSEALFGGDEGLSNFNPVKPGSAHDFFLTLIKIYNLHLGDLSPLDGEARYANHPKVAALKWDLENHWLGELGAINPLSNPQNLPSSEVIREYFSQEVHSLRGANLGSLKGKGSALNIYARPLGAAFLELSYLTPFRTLPECTEPKQNSQEMPELSYHSYPWELLALEAFAGLLATNHWLLPEALGALSAHSLVSGNKLAPSFEDANLPSNPDDIVEIGTLPEPQPHAVLSELDKLLGNRPEWSSRTLIGAAWYAHLDDALVKALAK